MKDHENHPGPGHDALPPLRTRAEQTDYRETSRHADVLAFLDTLCARTDLVRRASMGKSGEGQDMAILIASDRGCFSPEEARRQGKAVVMVEANIHAGEVEGKEALLALIRDLTIGPVDVRRGRDLLSRLCLVLIPNVNPDGNDRISPDNRRLDLAHLEGQVNPEGGVGTRYTGEGWNLNRDATKQEAVETRNLAALYHAWRPHLFIDCHTTDGSIHGYDLTFDTSRSNQDLFGRLQAKARGALEKVARRVERHHGFRGQWYGNFACEDDPRTGWHTYPPLVRFGSHYRGLLGRMDVLLETYSYLDFPRRCQVIYAWLLELLRFAARERRDLLRAVEREERRIVRRGQRFDPREQVGIHYGVARRDADGSLRFDYPAYALDGDEAQIESFDEESLRARRYPGAARRTYKVPHHRASVPTATVTTPAAYLVPASLAGRLAGHGISFTELPEGEHEVESYQILHIDRTFSPDVAGVVPPPGGAEVPQSAAPPPVRFETVLAVRAERRWALLPAGTLRVPTAQPAGTLAVYLLEPHSDDGFARWQFLDDQLQVGAYFPIHREPHAPPALARPKTEA